MTRKRLPGKVALQVNNSFSAFFGLRAKSPKRRGRHPSSCNNAVAFCFVPMKAGWKWFCKIFLFFKFKSASGTLPPGSECSKRSNKYDQVIFLTLYRFVFVFLGRSLASRLFAVPMLQQSLFTNSGLLFRSVNNCCERDCVHLAQNRF